MRRIVLVVVALSLLPTSRATWGQDPSRLTLDRIFKSGEFSSRSYGGVRWLSGSRGYSMQKPSKAVKGGSDIVRVDPETGKSEVMVSASELIPPGNAKPLRIESYRWSKNEARLLIFTNSRRVWRYRTRGDYWVYDVSSRELRKLGGADAAPASLQFAKFSPDGKKVAYVREKNVYVEDLASGQIHQLTRRRTPEIVNGTFDWVYEEELSLRDGIRWSPDSRWIAFWQLDTSNVRDYYLIDYISNLYPKIKKFKYPKAGTVNSACRVGVVPADGSRPPAWLDVPGDPRNHYIARMDWAPTIGSRQTIVLQQLNRLQNTNKVMLADIPPDGPQGDKVATRTIFIDRDKAWVDVYDTLEWFAKGRYFLWLSERDGWRKAYAVSRDGKKVYPITQAKHDVFDALAHIDERNGYLYYYASPADAAQCYLYRAKLRGGNDERVTPEKTGGTNRYDISPDSRWAIWTHTSFASPATISLVRLPDHKMHRKLEDNKKLREKLAKLKRGRSKFFKVDIGEGVLLDAWMMLPPDFDASKKYPVLFYVYGEPAGQTVLDSWRGNSYLWYVMLTQKGYVIMSVDNRGTPAPRGRDFRKIIYRQVGILAPKDQAAAVKAISRMFPWVDTQRIGVWGWSGGGTMSLHAIFRYPELYRMAMSVAPVTNERFYDTIYQERYMGLPSDNVHGYREGSPITHAHRLKGDLLIVHGTADDNVHYANTEALVNELIARNKQFSMMAYPNRTHSISEGRNTRRHLFGLLTRYLLEHLPPGPRIASGTKGK